MALKDTWKDLEDAVEGVENSGSEISVKPINDIARAVIKNEDDIKDLKENGGGASITVDDEMSSTSTNPVQNRVIAEKFASERNEWSGAIGHFSKIATEAKTIAEGCVPRQEFEDTIGNIETLLGGI